jgi:hypothetical protein
MANHAIIGIESTVEIQAADADKPKGPRSFTSTIYTGGPVQVAGWELPVVIDLAGLKTSKVLVANLDHKSNQRVGNFDVTNDGEKLIAAGKASAATSYRDEVINSADEGYQWQTSVEVKPHRVEELAKGKTAMVNGQKVEGPAYITRTGTLKGFAFVSHGADDNTTATIAASAASSAGKGKKMKTEVKAWAEAMGIDIEAASPEQLEVIEANYNWKSKIAKTIKASDPFEARKLEAQRRRDIRAFADQLMADVQDQPDEIEEIEKLTNHAIEAGIEAEKFRDRKSVV